MVVLLVVPRYQEKVVVRVPGGVVDRCDVVEPPGGPRGQEAYRGRLVVRAPGLTRLPRGGEASGASEEEEEGWCDLRRHPARRGPGGGGGGVEQLLLDSEEEELAMSRQPRGERDHVSRETRDPRDLRDLRDAHDLQDIRDTREPHSTSRHRRSDDYDYDPHPTTAAAASSALANNQVYFLSHLIVVLRKHNAKQFAFRFLK